MFSPSVRNFFVGRGIRVFCASIFFLGMCLKSVAEDCHTTANGVWSCGTPNPDDNLTISHQISINGDFTTSGDITVKSGGDLTITGKLRASNCMVDVGNGGVLRAGDLEIETGATLETWGDLNVTNNLKTKIGGKAILRGNATIGNDIRAEADSEFIIKKSANVIVADDFYNQTSDTQVDGSLTILDTFFNDGFISGVGTISFAICTSTGLINTMIPTTYCISSPVSLLPTHCSATDNIKPVFNTFPPDYTYYLDALSCDRQVTWTVPAVSDNCSVDDLLGTAKPGDLFSSGIHIVTYTLSDKAGNKAVRSFTITVYDTISPQIENVPVDFSVEVDFPNCGTEVSWTEPTATDNCGVTLVSDRAPGEFFDIGTHSVTYTATDDSGNSKIATFQIEVTNPHDPQFANCPKDTVIYVDEDNCDAVFTWIEPTALGCEVTVTQNHFPGEVFALGAHSISYAASDIGGKLATCEFVLEVKDTISPVIQNCPSTYSVDFVDTLGQQMIVSWVEPTATDQCDSVILTSNYKPGDRFDFGATKVIYDAKDASGNSSSCILEVFFTINQPPVVKDDNFNIESMGTADICLDASDPDDNAVSIYEILFNDDRAIITDVDSANLCFKSVPELWEEVIALELNIIEYICH